VIARLASRLVAGALGALAGCGAPAHETRFHAGEAAPARAPLVAVVVLDQIGSWVLERHLEQLPPSGAIRSAIARGAWHRRVAYEHAATLTAPGHAAIFTGTPPAESGVGANRRVVLGRGRTSIVDDGEHAVLGNDKAFASPSLLRAEGVVDVLERRTGGAARTLSISIKDRSAVIPGGKAADLAVWLDKRSGRFTTSTYYADAVPPWLAAWAAAHPIERALHDWTPSDTALLRAHAGEDDGPGEGDYLGFGATFPHRLRGEHALELFELSPASTEVLVELAIAGTRALGFGEDEVPDLLALSVSSTDLVGHTFGPESWEALDNLLRVDAALSRLLQALGRMAPVSLLITADHGVAPMPERSRAAGRVAVRYAGASLVGAADDALDRVLGAGDWVLGYAPPFVYLSAEARASARWPEARDAALAALRRVPGIAAAFDARAAESWRDDPDPLRRAVGRSIPPGGPGDVFIVSAPLSIYDEEVPVGRGTTHGSPWSYDAEVPVIIAGPGVSHLEVRERESARRIAATIAVLLGIEAPRHARVAPLSGLRAPR
jgi:hypothetical protein